MINDQENVKVVTVKNFPMRNRLMGIMSLPLLLLVSTIFAIPLTLFNLINFSTAIFMTVVSEIIVIFIALLYTNSLSIWSKKLRLTNFKWKNILAGATIGAGLMVLLQVFVYVFSLLGLGVESSDTSVSFGALTGFERYFLLYFFAPFVVPLIEEVFFRGYTMGFIEDSFDNKKKGAFWGILISTVAFACAHIQGFSNFNDFFLVGWIAFIAFVNGMLVHKTQSVYTSMAVHIAYNSLTVLVTILATM